MGEQSVIGVLMRNCVIGVDCRRRSDALITISVLHRAYISAIMNTGLPVRQPKDCDF